jgi:hypothetical protein
MTLIKREGNVVRLEGQGKSKGNRRRWHNRIPTCRRGRKTLLLLVDLSIMPSMFVHGQQ